MVTYGDWELAVSDVKGKMDRGELIPDPDWQRGYIWKLKDERLLIDSIMRQMPIPKFYLTEEYDAAKKANVHYAVDGQQRLRAIHKYLSNKFPVELNGRERYFKNLDSIAQQAVTTYKLTGHSMRDFTQADINFLFQRINRTGIKLTNMEVWNNEFYKTSILDLVKEIEREHRKFFEDVIYTEENVLRKVPQDDIIDLCHCLDDEQVRPARKNDLEEFLKDNRNISPGDQAKLKVRFRKVIRNLGEILSKEDLESSQYRKRTHFVSLFLAIGLLISRYYVLANPGHLRVELLRFIDNQPKRYKESVMGAIRDKEKRARRVTLLQKVILKRSKKLDPVRTFPENVKEKLWHKGHECQICRKQISSYRFSAVDHIEPWAKGGLTVESNAQLAHRTCNQRKQDKFVEFVLVSN